MDFDFKDIEIFEGKTLSNLFEDIYNNSNDKKEKISELIEQVQPFIIDVDSALIVVPLIKDYLDVGVKNDDQLNKLGTSLTRLVTAGDKSEGGGSSSGLTEEEKEELARLADADSGAVEKLEKVQKDVMDKIKNMETETEELPISEEEY